MMLTMPPRHGPPAARARAALHGHEVPTREDVRAVAPAVLRHRVLLNFEAEAAGLTADRVVAQILEEVGAVTRIVIHDDHARYELAEALTDHHHHHLICTSCGLVSDFELSAQVEQTLDGALRRTGRSKNFRIDGHRLDLIGACGTCA